MGDVYINLKELHGYSHITDYFIKRDLVSIGEIVDALEYELERQEKEEYTKDDYEYDMYEGRRAEEYGENS